MSTNLKSAKENIDILQTKIDREIAAGRVAGPFHTPPFENFRVSPLGLVPKRSSFRVIHHLSHPAGSSVNDGISDSNRTVNYQSIDNAVQIILQYGRKSTLSKIDIEHAYKIVPISPSSCHLLGFRLGDKYYFDKTLPMGLSYSCNLFEKFSNAVYWIVENKLGIQGCVHVLDDFLFISPPAIDTCTKSSDLTRFLIFAEKLGIPIKQEKTVFPTTKLTFLGLELDSELMEVRLPQDKLEKLRTILSSFLHRKKVTLLELQSLIGLLNFACAVVSPGRAFLRRIIDLTKGIQKPYHKRRLTKSAKADLTAWSLL